MSEHSKLIPRAPKHHFSRVKSSTFHLSKHENTVSPLPNILRKLLITLRNKKVRRKGKTYPWKSRKRWVATPFTGCRSSISTDNAEAEATIGSSREDNGARNLAVAWQLKPIQPTWQEVLSTRTRFRTFQHSNRHLIQVNKRWRENHELTSWIQAPLSL